MKIAENDPEFMEFLKEHDADLLDTQDMEEEEEVKEEEPMEQTSTIAGRKLRLRKDGDGRKIVDDDVVDFIEDGIKVDAETGQLKAQERVVHLAVKCFVACVARVGVKMDPPEFVVENQQVFERVVRMCFQQLTPVFYNLLGQVEKRTEEVREESDEDAEDEKIGDEDDEDDAEDSASEVASEQDYEKPVQAVDAVPTEIFKHWKKFSPLVKQFLQHLMMFLDEVRHDDVIFSTLKVIEQLAEIYIHYKVMRKRLVKSLIKIWSQKTERCRLMAFVALSKFCKLNDTIVPIVLKSCYVSYISNVRVVTPETLPLISLMQRTYAELAMIRPSITYPYMFVYIRQCSIHIRNAMIAKRKDMVRTVYNWQFVQSLYLWCEVIGKASKYHGREKNYQSIEELIFPLTQVVTATMKLFPSAKLLPLRLHCVRMFVQLQKSCDVFIPSLYHCAELLDNLIETTQKKPKTMNANFVGIRCILKASDTLLVDDAYRRAASEGLHELMLDSAYELATDSGFPDVVVPVDAKIRAFLKKSRSANDKTLFKDLLKVMREHAEHVNLVVLAKQVDLNDPASMESIHLALGMNSPLVKFYHTWKVQKEAQRKVLEDAQKSAEEEEKRMNKARKVEINGE
ncbi:hypothetical protein L596_002453 [Steinernema carpocapsae]|nr:hypothetical protein L596_002453 [Steinernema carpocapsae]